MRLVRPSWNHRSAAVSEGPAASTCGCAKSPNDPKTRGLSLPLRLVLRTHKHKPRSVPARFWWWYRYAQPRGPGLFFCKREALDSTTGGDLLQYFDTMRYGTGDKTEAFHRA